MDLLSRRTADWLRIMPPPAKMVVWISLELWEGRGKSKGVCLLSGGKGAASPAIGRWLIIETAKGAGSFALTSPLPFLHLLPLSSVLPEALTACPCRQFRETFAL